MEARLTTKGFSFDFDTEEVRPVLHAEGFDAVPTLTERVYKIDGVVSYEWHGDARFTVMFQVDDNGVPKGFAAVQDEIAEHLRVCESFCIYVGHSFDDADGKRLLHAGDGFVLCDSAVSGKGDMGVSLHFLYDGQRASKWFTDGAAEQFRRLAAQGDSRRIHAIVAKHIDLDPKTPAPSPGR